MGVAASKLFGGLSLLVLTLCCDIRDVLFVDFLSKPDGKSALITSNSLGE